MDVLARDVTLAALTASQSALTRRLNLLAQNIANVNTPDYKRRDITFTDELAEALRQPATSRGERSARVGSVVAREMVELAKAQVKGTVLQQLVYKKIRQYRSVIRDGRI